MLGILLAAGEVINLHPSIPHGVVETSVEVIIMLFLRPVVVVVCDVLADIRAERAKRQALLKKKGHGLHTAFERAKKHVQKAHAIHKHKAL